MVEPEKTVYDADGRELLDDQLLQNQMLLQNAAIESKRRDRTLVVYVYNAADEDEQRNFAYFLRYGITDGPTYRLVITSGEGVLDFPQLPTLPSNAQYIKTDACTHTWGGIDSISTSLPTSQHEYIVVVDSSARGPYLPTYIDKNTLHWTEAFTAKINLKTKLVGSTISCEGAPVNGDASLEWRANPHVSSYAFATDSEGWRVLSTAADVMHCHTNSWDARYYSEVGGSLAIIQAGYGLDTLLTRYQSVDWSDIKNWNCNQRVRPDFQLHYDSISITPYETIFVPINTGSLDNDWAYAKTAEKYEEWADRLLRPAANRPGVESNSWISDHWSVKAEKLVAMNSRGPNCFDFPYYVQHNLDLQYMAREPLSLWEHFLLLGQFQGRRHKFTCPLNVGNSYRVSYITARGPRCFDADYYADHHRDLENAGLTHAYQLFGHFAEFGQFERRKARFVCADSYMGLPAGFDSEEDGDKATARGALSEKRGANEQEAALQERLLEVENGMDDLDDLETLAVVDPVQQALKGVLVSESAKNIFKKKKSG